MSAFGTTTSLSSTPLTGNALSPSDCNLPQPGNDGISSISWSPTANILISSSWDSGVRGWEVQEQSGMVRATPRAQVNHPNGAPVLDTCFSDDGSTVFSCGGDKAVRMWQLGQTPPNNTPQQIGVHDQPVKGVGFLRSTKLVVSGGWDRKLKFWDTRSPNPAGVFDLPERVYAMDVHENLLVVATADRQILSYDCTGQPREYSRKESPLKYQTRCITCFPDSSGFAIGSIEGRVGIHYLQKISGKESFAFKCHRHDQNVFAVNAIAFNKVHGTFATCGADGVVNFWDKDNKQRLKGFPQTQRTVSCAAFNATGSLFAYASSYDWSKGSQYVQPGNEIFIHYVPDEEIRPKNKKTTSSFKH